MDILIAQLWPYLVTLAGLIAGFFYVRQSGKAAARNEDAAQINKQAEQARKESRDVENTVAKMGDDAVADKLKSDWVRVDKSRD